MRFRRFFILLAVPSALAAGASCAPVAIFAGYGAPAGGEAAGGGATDTGTFAMGGSGSTGITFDGGMDATITSPKHSYTYLCGSEQAQCLPGAKTDSCADMGTGGSGGGDGPLSCQVLPLADADAGVTAECRGSGSFTVGQTCTGASDCAPELGCIAGLAPTCRSYCCDSVESCPQDTYCVPSPMFEAPQNLIPVCIPVTTCKLLQDSAACKPGLTCAIVRADGTTSCVTPGTGTEGQACPCAAGYTCSESDGTCLQLCDVSKPACPGKEICQGGTYPYPKEVGICVK